MIALTPAKHGSAGQSQQLANAAGHPWLTNTILAGPHLAAASQLRLQSQDHPRFSSIKDQEMYDVSSHNYSPANTPETRLSASSLSRFSLSSFSRFNSSARRAWQQQQQHNKTIAHASLEPRPDAALQL
jgi:hypothetical protein